MNIFELKDSCRSNFNKYTIKAFETLPRIKNPIILDIGCGTGVPILEIAKLTNGKIVAIDSNKDSLDWLKQKVNALHYTERFSIINDSIFDVKFSKNSFDIILAEGIFNIIGFEKGLRRFSKYLKETGYFIIHDDLIDQKRKMQIIEKYHFQLVSSLILNEKAWWKEYYSCLERKIKKYEKTKSTPNKALQQERTEIEMYKKNPLMFRSVYYVLKKS